ncbi:MULTISPECIES: hypothetical protein [unclassified Streptomyces]|uniref:hypothetical protein n=1 Tax=unclassified Streptomyces TaxID=2593676 RepID=UPI00225B928F|nr:MULTISPECIES: hypothetical protein [unclassified Streptomyces]MCX5141018.1 hypothetical protein [Streptomyces sp. NBC_00338]WRZ65513.1 hypothetical protein OG408_17225 [Streptomyces sp. NBC_01257]WSU59509.1 hypothetical protein OG450_17400 [Streptomyces sp. NBC_01104]
MPDDILTAPQPRTWIAALVSTLVTLPLAGLARFFGALSPMACDSCSDAQSDRFDASFDLAWPLLSGGLVLSLLLLFTSWVLSSSRPPAAVPVAVLAPVTVVVTYVAFAAMIDWP